MGRGNTSWEKRQREKAKRERKEAKRARREERKDAAGIEPVVEGPTPDELMEQFAELGRKHAAGQLSDDAFEAARSEIFEQVGLAGLVG